MFDVKAVLMFMMLLIAGEEDEVEVGYVVVCCMDATRSAVL